MNCPRPLKALLWSALLLAGTVQGAQRAIIGTQLEPPILDPTAKTVDELKKLNLPAGVDITIKI